MDDVQKEKKFGQSFSNIDSNKLDDSKEQNYNEIELTPLNGICICQLCKNNFNNQENLPFLLKCGHFFCKTCLSKQSSNVSKIICPIDGPVANSIKDLQILNDFIPKTIDNIKKNNANNTKCQIHINSPLTHVIENSKNILCIYCAIDFRKNNPNIEVYEIKEVLSKYNEEIEKLLDFSNKNIEIIKKIIDSNGKDKIKEVNKLNSYFNQIIKYINTIKESIIDKIEKIYKNNKNVLRYHIQIISNKQKFYLNIKNKIKNYEKNKNFADIFDEFENVHKNYISDVKKNIKDICLEKIKIEKLLNLTEMNNIINQFQQIIRPVCEQKKSNEKYKLRNYLIAYENSNINYRYDYINNINNIHLNKCESEKYIKKPNLKKNIICNNNYMNIDNMEINNENKIININNKNKSNKKISKKNVPNETEPNNINNLLKRTNNVLYKGSKKNYPYFEFM